MTTCDAFSYGATSCRLTVAGISVEAWWSAHSVCCTRICAAIRTPRREPVMKPVGKPDAGNPHVRFDERGGETGRAYDTAPLLDSTDKNTCFSRCLKVT